MFKPSVLGLAKLTYRVAQFGPIRKARLQRKFEEQGAALVERIKDAAPVRKGHLRASIRIQPKTKKPGVLILAGGTPGTTKRTRRGRSYDEALLTEYGTTREAPEPFFWPTIRAAQGDLIAKVADDLKQDES